jgi:hypothetical protein
MLPNPKYTPVDPNKHELEEGPWYEDSMTNGSANTDNDGEVFQSDAT